MLSAKNICLSFFLFYSLLNNAEAQGFLKAKDKQMVNEKGENVLLRGIGLGGWMLQEGYMLGLRNNWQQQNQIRKHIDTLVGKDGTKAFYDAWLSNHTTKKDIDYTLKTLSQILTKLKKWYN